ncbi:MAG: Hpt domain-containing protein [Gemmatimonadales bacterium]|nr:MAG: Hpt domain-containing protein [Gemmatimonadales bacterium]
MTDSSTRGAGDPQSQGAPVILDPAALDRLREWGGDALLGRMVSLFLELGPERVGSLSGALSDGDLELLERTAHSLKSSSGNVGALRLSAAAAELESAARGARAGEGQETLTELVEAVCRSWEQTSQALERAVPAQGESE